MRVGLGVVGVLMVLAGGVFAGQGLGYIPGSYMTGQTLHVNGGMAMI